MSINKGFFLVNKPAGWTSHDVVAKLRGVVGEKTIGHAGTLDPFATGLLIVGVGREATKRLDEFKSLPKTYRAVIRLGASSTTGDPSGEITEAVPATLGIPAQADVKKTLKAFVGKQTQIPPMYSAKKVGGKKLYELARKGKTVQRAPHAIEVYQLHMLTYAWPHLTVETTVSAGTYVRTLAQDIGAALDVGAYCEALERTAIGNYRLIDAGSVEHPQKIKEHQPH